MRYHGFRHINFKRFSKVKTLWAEILSILSYHERKTHNLLVFVRKNCRAGTLPGCIEIFGKRCVSILIPGSFRRFATPRAEISSVLAYLQRLTHKSVSKALPHSADEVVAPRPLGVRIDRLEVSGKTNARCGTRSVDAGAAAIGVSMFWGYPYH